MTKMVSNSQLIPLLPTTPYLLAYALPLLLLSLLVTFAGTFLTVDRSRSFPPADGAIATGKGYAAVPGGLPFEKSKKKTSVDWYFEGGIGGSAAGYIFGLHLSTALSLIIPATTPSAPLSDKSFLAIWILSCIVTTPLAARYRYAALTFLGVTGGTLTALALCIITHPTLKSRIVVVSIFLPLFTIVVLLASTIPVPRVTAHFFRPFLRLCSASTGAFGVVMSIALLMNPKEEGWANAWERLWMADGPSEGSTWGTAQEQGLSAAWAVFVAAGMAADWALHRWIGECPDEKWDNYLAQYAANLPNQADRAGTFQPLTSFWDKIFPSATPAAPFSKDILFPSEADMKSKSPFPLPVTMHNMGSSGILTKGDKDMGAAKLTRVPTSVELLKKKRSKARHGAWKFIHAEGKERKERKPIKFGELSDDSDSDDDLDDVKKAPISPSPASSSPIIEQQDMKRPWGLTNAHHASSTSSTPTLVGGPRGVASDPRLDALDTLDYDREIAQLKERRKKAGGDDRDDLDYSDYEEDISAPKPDQGKADELQESATWSPAFLKRHQSQQGDQAVPMPMPVPATPSLIKAIDRLAVAQREAYGPSAASAVSPGPPMSPLAQPQAPAVNAIAVRTSTPPGGRSNSKSPRGRNATLEDAEAGAVGVPHGAPASKKADRAPRWEEFWREVRVKARS